MTVPMPTPRPTPKPPPLTFAAAVLNIVTLSFVVEPHMPFLHFPFVATREHADLADPRTHIRPDDHRHGQES